MEIFQNYAYYYNAFYKDKDYRMEAKQTDGLLKKYGKNINKLINFGCGTGRHDIELADLGYQCAGIDISPVMIDIARKNAEMLNKEIVFSVGDIREYFSEQRYDAVISLFHVISYQKRNEDVLNTLKSARSILDKGGIFLFDVWYGPGVLSDKPRVKVKEAEDEEYKMVRIARPVLHDRENVVDVCYQIYAIDKESSIVKEINEVHSMRYFFRPELEFLLQKTGFELIENLDCATLGETTFDTWTSYFIAKAI